jgi:hypothetical protein
MVEELHRQLNGLSVIHFDKIRNGVPHDWAKAFEGVTNNLCDGEKYAHFATHIRDGCKVMLHGKKKKVVEAIMHRVHPIHTHIGTFRQGKGYHHKHAVWRRRLICEDVFGVCPEAPPPLPVSDCRACAEVFRDFHFVTRRDTGPAHVRPHFQNQVAFRRKRLYGQITDLCEDVHMRHSFSHADTVAETCHKLVAEHREAILEVYLNMTKQPGCPAERVCVDIARDCTKRQFARVSGHLEHEHDWEKRARVLAGPLAGGEHLEL